VQEPGCGARHSLQRCGKQGAVHGLRVQGRGLPHTETEEGGIVSVRKLKADAAIDHR
jgi:hypothetical protein